MGLGAKLTLGSWQHTHHVGKRRGCDGGGARRQAPGKRRRVLELVVLLCIVACRRGCSARAALRSDKEFTWTLHAL